MWWLTVLSRIVWTCLKNVVLLPPPPPFLCTYSTIVSLGCIAAFCHSVPTVLCAYLCAHFSPQGLLRDFFTLLYVDAYFIYYVFFLKLKISALSVVSRAWWFSQKKESYHQKLAEKCLYKLKNAPSYEHNEKLHNATRHSLGRDFAYGQKIQFQFH